MNPGERTFRGPDGREWTAAIEAPELLLDVPPDLQNSGAMLPGDAVRIVFRSGDEELSEEYTGLSAVEDLSDDDLRDWLEAAMRGQGL